MAPGTRPTTARLALILGTLTASGPPSIRLAFYTLAARPQVQPVAAD